tara:strand:- start:1566 stop:2663 length:1098 start_codon:yes stop_codon:yes gene_type:complete
MKICYLSNTAIGSKYASSIQIVKMCEAFSELGNDVILITRQSAKKRNIFETYDVKFKYNIKFLENFKTFPLGIKYYLFSLISIFESFKYKPEIYITRNFFTCFLLILFRKKTILELHHDLNMESRIVRFLVKNLNFLNSNYIKKLVAITNGIKKVFINKYSVNENKILVSPSGSSIKKNFFFTNNKHHFKIGYFGSLYNSRGSNLIYKLAKIDKKNQYFLYGDLNKLENNKKYSFIKNLFLHDWVPYKKISKILSKMDILLMPYTSSIKVAGNVGDITKFTSPLKLFDYLSAGKIIICSDFAVLKEAIKEKNNAIFVKNYTNAFSWRNEIQKLKNQPYKQLIISKNNHKLSKKYSLILRAKKILE